MKLHLVTTHRALPALYELDDVICTISFWEWGTLNTAIVQLDRVIPVSEDEDIEQVRFFYPSRTQEMVFDRPGQLYVTEIESITVSN